MKDRYNSIYASFNLKDQSVALAKNILRVDPYSVEGCLTILVYAFLVDSYHIPELASSVIVGHLKDVITQMADVAVHEDPVALVIVDKALVVVPVEPVVAINLMDLSEIEADKLAAIVANPVTSDVINLTAILNRIITPVLSAREDQAAEAAQ